MIIRQNKSSQVLGLTSYHSEERCSKRSQPTLTLQTDATWLQHCWDNMNVPVGLESVAKPHPHDWSIRIAGFINSISVHPPIFPFFGMCFAKYVPSTTKNACLTSPSPDTSSVVAPPAMVLMVPALRSKHLTRPFSVSAMYSSCEVESKARPGGDASKDVDFYGKNWKIYQSIRFDIQSTILLFLPNNEQRSTDLVFLERVLSCCLDLLGNFWQEMILKWELTTKNQEVELLPPRSCISRTQHRGFTKKSGGSQEISGKSKIIWNISHLW